MRKKWISGISAVCLILLLPFFNWIRVVNLVDLFSRIGVTKDMAADLLTGYNLYNLLSFVQYANQGVLGLFAMVLLILAAAIYFNVAQYGLINNLVTSMGGERIDFYNNPSYWPFLITFFYLWKNIGYGMVVYLATIMGIDNEIYEAARVDGANELQQIWYITLPHIKPTFIILLLYALGSIMKGQFELFYQLIGNNGVLFNATDIFDTYVYRITMTQPLSIGLGTAAGLYQSLFGFLIIVLVNYVVKKKNPEYALF